MHDPPLQKSMLVSSWCNLVALKKLHYNRQWAISLFCSFLVVILIVSGELCNDVISTTTIFIIFIIVALYLLFLFLPLHL